MGKRNSNLLINLDPKPARGRESYEVLAEMSAAGASQTEIARELGVKPSSIPRMARAARSYGVEVAGVKAGRTVVERDERKQQIKELWDAGVSSAEIAKKLDLTVPSLWTKMSTMRKEGWDLPYRDGGSRKTRQAASKKAWRKRKGTGKPRSK